MERWFDLHVYWANWGTGEIETDIGQGNAAGYLRATNLLVDLEYLADENGTTDTFMLRLASIRERHVKKRTLMERLARALSV